MPGDRTLATAETLGKATDPTEAFRPPPGLKSPTGEDTYRTGDIGIDKGPLCKRDPSHDGCFMEAEQRNELIKEVAGNLIEASTNYKIALEVIRTTMSIKPEDDLGWLSTLVLETLAGSLISALAKKLSSVRNAARRTASGTAQKALGQLHPERIKEGVKTAIEMGKDATIEATEDNQNDPATTKKEATGDYITFLSDQANRSFRYLRTDTLKNATDAELHWLWQTFKDPDAHSISVYKAALKAKISRFHKAGIHKIGQSWEEAGSISRHTRVVAVHFTSGHPTEFWLERWDMAAQVMDGADMNPREFKPSAPKTREPQMVSRVPDEFVEAAKARQLQIWGKDVTAYRIIDESEREPWIYGEERYQRALAKRRGDTAPQKSKPAPAASATGPTMPRPKPLQSAIHQPTPPSDIGSSGRT